MSNFVLGLDLGQAQDYTALSILERMNREASDPPNMPPMLHCRHLQRFELGTLYPAIVSAVKDMLSTPQLKGSELIIDATGVGRAVCDMFTAAKISHKRIIVTAGDHITEEGGYWRVPKRDLVSAVQAPLQTKRIKFAEGLALIPTLIQEMLNFKVKITISANDTYGAWREGEHDDLIFAVMLASWWAYRGSELSMAVIPAQIYGQPRRGVALPAGEQPTTRHSRQDARGRRLFGSRT